MSIHLTSLFLDFVTVFELHRLLSATDPSSNFDPKQTCMYVIFFKDKHSFLSFSLFCSGRIVKNPEGNQRTIRVETILQSMFYGWILLLSKYFENKSGLPLSCKVFSGVYRGKIIKKKQRTDSHTIFLFFGWNSASECFSQATGDSSLGVGDGSFLLHFPQNKNTAWQDAQTVFSHVEFEVKACV